MKKTHLLLFFLIIQPCIPQSVVEPDCDIRSSIVMTVGDSSVIQLLSIEQFSPSDCSLLTKRGAMFGPGADLTAASDMVRNISRASELYSAERAGPASARAFELLLQRQGSGDTLGAVRAGIVAEFLRPLYILSKKRSLSALVDTVRRSMDLGAYTASAMLLDTLESQSKLYLNGLAYKDSILFLRRQLSQLIGKAEHDHALYGREEESQFRYTLSATVAGVYLSEITGIEWTMNTIEPTMIISIVDVRLTPSLLFPFGIRFGYALNNSFSLECEASYSTDTQKEFRVGSYVSPAGFRRTVLSGELGLKYRFRTTVGLRPYVAVGAAAAQLRRSEFHPARKIFDATYIGFTIITPPKEYVIPEQTAKASSFIIAVGDELLLSSAEGWISDFFIGARMTGSSNGIIAKTSYAVGFRAGYTW